MLRATLPLGRYRTPWRELLHPLSVTARHSQWMKRDQVEINESILRQPYYTFRSHAAPPGNDPLSNAEGKMYNVKGYYEAQYFNEANGSDGPSPQDPNYGVQKQLGLQPRVAVSRERLAELREMLQFPNAGPMPREDDTNNNNKDGGRRPVLYEEEYGARLYPRYPQSWETVPPHSPSANQL